ncbi:MAG TPA: acyltransferase family protein [Acidimicrobiales bacterium]|jgi:peptidoglycan/LPS O-acetylase OafA/YrhL
MAAVVGDAPAAVGPGTRRPALDGLRGVAVAAVLAFHGGMPWAEGGFLGVDVFFVLSGYLITTLLLDEGSATGGLRLGRFWRYRAARLLPPLLAVVAATVALRLGAGDRTDAALRGDGLGALAYVANWRFVAGAASYFGEAAPPSPLLHTWSLAVEEQFYLVWPLVVGLALRWRRPLVALAAVAGLGAAGSTVLMAALHRPLTDPSRVYLGTDTHATGLLVGALLAVGLARRGGRPVPGAGVAGVAGAAVLAWMTVAVDGGRADLYEGGLLAAALAAGTVVAAVELAPGAAVGRALSARPLVALGRISYGVYLWHWPLFLALNGARTGLTGWPLLAVRSLVTVAVAAASHRLLELPVRARRDRSPRLALGLAGAVAVTAVVVVVATVGGPAAAPVVAAAPPPPTTAPPSTTAPAPPGTAGAAKAAAVTVASTTTSTRPPPVGDVKVLLVGDSVAMTMAQGLPDVSGYGVDLVSEARLGCGIVRGGPYRYFGAEKEQLPECETWPETWAGWIATHDPDVVAVLVGRWEVMERVHDGEWAHVGQPAFDAYLLEELETMVAVTTARGARVALLTAPYYRRGERPDGGIFPEDEPARVDAWNRLVREVAARHPGSVTLVEFGAHVTPGTEYVRDVDGVRVRSDGVHVTVSGAHWIAPWLFPRLAAIGRGTG